MVVSGIQILGKIEVFVDRNLKVRWKTLGYLGLPAAEDVTLKEFVTFKREKICRVK